MVDVIRKIFYISRTRTTNQYFEVEAKTKKEALELFDEDYHEYTDSDFVREGQPKIHSTTVIVLCGNKGHAWTDVPLAAVENGDAEPGGWKWHYNGRCEGEKQQEHSHCHVCRRAIRNGYRLLTLKERQYLFNRYPGDKPELLVD